MGVGLVQLAIDTASHTVSKYNVVACGFPFTEKVLDLVRRHELRALDRQNKGRNDLTIRKYLCVAAGNAQAIEAAGTRFAKMMNQVTASFQIFPVLIIWPAVGVALHTVAKDHRFVDKPERTKDEPIKSKCIIFYFLVFLFRSVKRVPSRRKQVIDLFENALGTARIDELGNVIDRQLGLV